MFAGRGGGGVLGRGGVGWVFVGVVVFCLNYFVEGKFLD